MLKRMQLRRHNKNQKGFTLVELMATLGILALIVAIAVPAIGNIMTKAQEQASESQDNMVIEAAKIAEANGEPSSGGVIPGPKSGEVVYTLYDLVNKGYLDTELIDTRGFTNEQLAALSDDELWESMKVQKVQGNPHVFTVERGNREG